MGPDGGKVNLFIHSYQQVHPLHYDEANTLALSFTPIGSLSLPVAACIGVR